MNVINPFIYAQPALFADKFIAPANFTPESQELNIVDAISTYMDANKKYVFSVNPSALTTELPHVTERSYVYSENGGGYIPIHDGTITWTTGSNKRYVIALDTRSSITATVPIGAVWLYVTDKCYSIATNNDGYHYNPDLISIHAQNLNSLVSLAYGAFIKCTGLLGDLVIPNSMVSIGTSAFLECGNLTSVEFPDSLTVIADWAFRDCIGLSCELVLPKFLTTIGDNAFYNCPKLVGNLTIPNTVTYLGNASFQGCTRLNGILTLPTAINTIAESTFYGCGFTGNLVIPGNVVTISQFAFSQCLSLSGNLTIQQGVTSIGYASFYYCTHLAGTLDIPSSVATIGNYAFEPCPLTRINCRRVSPPTGLDSDTFGGVNKTNCILHVPVGSLAAYRAAQYWTDFVTIIEDL